MKIDINKKYRYRMGDPVRILCVDAVGPKCGGRPQPVVALDSKDGDVTFHFEDGKFDSVAANEPLDLIEVREPREWRASVVTIRSQDGDYQDHREIGDILAYDWGDEAKGYEVIRVREIID